MEYVESRNGGLYVAGSRVSLASVIYGFRNGDSPQTICTNFPALSLAQVYGALADYLNHPADCEEYLRAQELQWEALRQSPIASPLTAQPRR